jgi:transposase
MEASLDLRRDRGAGLARTGRTTLQAQPAQQAKLAALLEAGPAAHGWDEEQTWTGARVKTLISRTFHVSYSVSGATRLMRRLGFHPPGAHPSGGRA